MTVVDPRSRPDGLLISVSDSKATLAAMLRVLTDGADGGFVISYARGMQTPVDLIVDEITGDDDELPFIVGRLWDDGVVSDPVEFPVSGASVHIY